MVEPETALMLASIEHTSTALYVHGELSFTDAWAEMQALEHAEHAMPYWMGDLYNWMVGRFGDEAFQAIQIDIQRTTAYTYGWVCRRFPPGDPARELGLSLSTLRLAASLCYEQPALAYAILKDHADNKFRRKELQLRLQLEREKLKALPAPDTSRDSGTDADDRAADEATEGLEDPFRRRETARPEAGPVVLVERPHRTRPGLCATCSCVLEEDAHVDAATPSDPPPPG